MCMSLVDKEAGNPARACAEVLVGTPAGKVHTPVVKMELHIASSVGEVKACITSLCMEVGREEGRGVKKGGEEEEEEGGQERGRRGKEEGGEGGEGKGGRGRGEGRGRENERMRMHSNQ